MLEDSSVPALSREGSLSYPLQVPRKQQKGHLAEVPPSAPAVPSRLQGSSTRPTGPQA